MKDNKVLIGVVLIGFAGLNIFAAVTSGIAGLQEVIATGNAWNLVLFEDLCIALGMVSIWLYRDAKSRGVSPFPYLITTFTIGSIGPLFYLLRRQQDPSPQSNAGSAALGLRS